MVDGFTYFAWFVMAVLFLVVVWLIVALGSLPKKIALKRNHPQVDAINAASWIGLLLMGVGWPIAFVWAFLRTGDWGAAATNDDDPRLAKEATADAREILRLQQIITDLQTELKSLQSENG